MDDGKSSKGKFDSFLKFLERAKNQVEYRTSDARSSGDDKSKTKYCFVTGKTYTIGSKPRDTGVTSGRQEGAAGARRFQLLPCLACNHDGVTDMKATCHSMESCEVWASLTLDQREKKIKCKKHPFATDHTTATCKRNIKPCKHCNQPNHHFLMCKMHKSKSHKATVSKVTTEVSDTKANSAKSEVIVKSMFVKGSGRGRVYGAMQDNCSTDNYITHEKAAAYDLKGEEVVLEIEGINDTTTYETKLYKVPIKDKSNKTHVLDCYGLDKIASEAELPDEDSYANLCHRLGIHPEQVRRPKKIDLLISQREAHLMLDDVKLQDKAV